MPLARDEGKTIGQSGYWSRFAVYMIGVPALLVAAVIAFLARHYALGVLCIFGIVPVSFWFRFVMMRRCRDIGWPIWLPWLAMILQFLVFFMAGAGSLMSGDFGALRSISSGSMLISFADLAFVIVLGCVASRPDFDYDKVFGGEPLPRAQAAGAPMDYRPGNLSEDPDAAREREDAAIARALEAYRNGGTQQAAPAEQATRQSPAAAPAPAPFTRPVGFGRKGLS